MCRYQVGQKFTDRQGRAYEVVDILTTRNLSGEIVKVRYVASHLVMGQKVLDHDVLETSIARALAA